MGHDTQNATSPVIGRLCPSDPGTRLASASGSAHAQSQPRLALSPPSRGRGGSRTPFLLVPASGSARAHADPSGWSPRGAVASGGVWWRLVASCGVRWHPVASGGVWPRAVFYGSRWRDSTTAHPGSQAKGPNRRRDPEKAGRGWEGDARPPRASGFCVLISRLRPSRV